MDSNGTSIRKKKKRKLLRRTWLARLKKMIKQEYGIDTENKSGYGYFQDISILGRRYNQLSIFS